MALANLALSMIVHLCDLECATIVSLSCHNSTLYASVKHDSGLSSVLQLTLGEASTCSVIVSADVGCPAILGVSAYSQGLAFCQGTQIKLFDSSSKTVSVLAGGGLRGCNTGSSLTASFKQPKDLCVENDNTFFVVDPAAGCLLMITPTEGSVSFLQTLKKVYSA